MISPTSPAWDVNHSPVLSHLYTINTKIVAVRGEFLATSLIISSISIHKNQHYLFIKQFVPVAGYMEQWV